jgi:transcriptional regulator with XRE-family HTH domain
MRRSPYSPAYATVVAALVEARKAAGLTQVELAERLSKPQSFVSKIERSERRVDVLEFCAIARALGVRPAVLLALIDSELPAHIIS